MTFGQGLRAVLKDLSLRTGLLHRTFFNVYPLMFNPQQLGVLDEAVGSVKGVSGCFVEAGCAFGSTTVFLNQSMDGHGIVTDYYGRGLLRQGRGSEGQRQGAGQNDAGHGVFPKSARPPPGRRLYSRWARPGSIPRLQS